MTEDALNFAKRVSGPYSDELKIYKANIYKILGTGDDRLQVRILPYMMDIPNSELDNLPKYPPFIKGRVIVGNSEVADGKDKADRVYVACTPDFGFGFILGIANEFEGNTKSQFTGSYSYHNLSSFLAQRGAKPSDFDYENIDVEINDQGDGTGGIMEFHNRKTGDFFIVNTSGTFFTVQRDQIIMRVGSPPELPGGSNIFSQIKMTSTNVEVSTKVFDVSATNIILGHHGTYLLSTNSLVPFFLNGLVLMPIQTIAV